MLRDDSPERAAVEAAGWEIAEDGMEVGYERGRRDARRSAATSSSSGCGARARRRYHDHHRYHLLMHDGQAHPACSSSSGC